jgi:hypothetical protein
LAVTLKEDIENERFLKQEQQEEEEEDPMANFIYALKAAGTKRQWPRRLKIFFDFLDLSSDVLEEQAREFVKNTRNNPKWTQGSLIRFLNFQHERVMKKEISEAKIGKLYANNTILFNQIQTPEKSESVNTISQRSELVRSVNKQVRVYDEESHFESSNDYIKHLYSQVKELILSIGPDINIRPRVKYISFVRKRNFVDIVVR